MYVCVLISLSLSLSGLRHRRSPVGLPGRGVSVCVCVCVCVRRSGLATSNQEMKKIKGFISFLIISLFSWCHTVYQAAIVVFDFRCFWGYFVRFFCMCVWEGGGGVGK